MLSPACYSTPVDASVKTSDHRAEWTVTARKVMETEAQAILAASTRLENHLEAAVELILSHPGKIIVTGLGKSGHVARKIAATLQSTGTPAVFLHPAEAIHGDLGVCQAGRPRANGVEKKRSDRRVGSAYARICANYARSSSESWEI